jgi:hypothetical protein
MAPPVCIRERDIEVGLVELQAHGHRPPRRDRHRRHCHYRRIE